VVVPGLRPSVGQMSRLAVRGDTIHSVLEQHEVDLARGGGPVRACQWWAVRPEGTAPRRVATGLPPVRGVWESSHYGLVALVESGPGRDAVLHAVEFPDPAAVKGGGP
jgi:hypothetical protein